MSEHIRKILKRAKTAVKYLPCDRFTLLRIPKTGHTSMIKRFNLGQTLDPDEVVDPLIAVVRHPEERLISGLQQCIKIGTTNAKTVEQLLDDIDQRGFFDEHIIPMWCFWDDRVSKVYQLKWIQEFESDYGVQLPHYNKSKPYIGVINGETRKRIERLYQPDYDLYWSRGR